MNSDNDSAQDEESAKHKKRRLRGACDLCRKRKVKCESEGGKGPIPCKNCELAEVPCTHAPPLPRKKERTENLIRSMEERIVKLEQFIRLLFPDRDIDILITEVFTAPFTTDSSLKSIPELKYPIPHLPSAVASSDTESSPEPPQRPTDPEEEQQDLSHVGLSDHLNKLLIEDKRFFGQSSSYMLAHYTIHAKLDSSGNNASPYPLNSSNLRRPLYWEMRDWELSFARVQQTPFTFPDEDLLNSLVSLYFDKSNIYIPVLHKPTFLRSLSSGLHLTDSGFGMTVLLVCAIASRFTLDTRVLLEQDLHGLSSGWKFYSQVPSFRNQLFERSTLYDLQFYVLSTVYLLGTSMIHVAWPMLGLGIRFAQEKGLHRRKGSNKLTVEEEAEKRVFWCQIVIDRWMSAYLGRPCSMQDEEFDVEYPVECDDEYWETPDPNDAFKQPPGKPSKMTYFIWTIKLVEILGFALRTLYGTKKSKSLIGFIGQDWEPQVVAELDSSLNKFRDSVPPFLRWNPDIPDNIFFSQSVALHACFYHLQIQIHRPFLMKRSALTHSSLAICSNAGRSTAHVLEAALSRGVGLFPSLYMSAFAAVSGLLLIHWVYQQNSESDDSLGNGNGNGNGSNINGKATTMEYVRKLLNSLKDGERKWHVAGRLYDLSQILGCLSEHRSTAHLKRRREWGNGNNPTSPAPAATTSASASTIYHQPSTQPPRPHSPPPPPPAASTCSQVRPPTLPSISQIQPRNDNYGYDYPTTAGPVPNGTSGSGGSSIWEHTSLVGETLQRQVAAAKLGVSPYQVGVGGSMYLGNGVDDGQQQHQQQPWANNDEVGPSMYNNTQPLYGLLPPAPLYQNRSDDDERDRRTMLPPILENPSASLPPPDSGPYFSHPQYLQQQHYQQQQCGLLGFGAASPTPASATSPPPHHFVNLQPSASVPTLPPIISLTPPQLAQQQQQFLLQRQQQQQQPPRQPQQYDPSMMEVGDDSDVYQMWANLPLNLSSYEWESFLMDAMQYPPPPPSV